MEETKALLIQALDNFKKDDLISETGFKLSKDNKSNEVSFILGEDCYMGQILMLDNSTGLMMIAKYDEVSTEKYQKEWERLNNQKFMIQDI